MKIFDVKTEEVLRKTGAVVEWWNKNSETTDYHSISGKRNELTSLLAFLSEIFAREQVKNDYKYIERKVKEAEILSEYKEKIEVKSFAHAERLTDKDERFVKAYKSQKDVEANFERLKHLIRQCNAILLAMHQTISIAVKEKENLSHG